MEAVGVEPTLFTTRERIYSPLQNTPYLQCLQILTYVNTLNIGDYSLTDEPEFSQMYLHMVGAQRIEL